MQNSKIIALVATLVINWPAHAVVQSALMGDANLTLSNTTQNIVTTRALTAPRTIFLPAAAATLLGQSGASTYYQNCLTFFDQAGGVSSSNTVQFLAASPDTINGASSLTINVPNLRVTMCPVNGSGWYASIAPQSSIVPSLPLSVANGGTGASTASGISLDNITGFVSTGLLNRTGTGAYSFVPLPLSSTNGGTGLDGTLTGARKANGTGVDTQAACADLSDGTTNCSAAVGQLPGTTTNDNAASGKVGEYVTAQLLRVSAITLANNTPANITSVSLTAGDWDVTGILGYIPGATTATTNIGWSVSTTSATMGSLDSVGRGNFPTVPANSFDLLLPTPAARISLASTTTVYLVANVAFTSTAPVVYGTIRARRIR